MTNLYFHKYSGFLCFFEKSVCLWGMECVCVCVWWEGGGVVEGAGKVHERKRETQ